MIVPGNLQVEFSFNNEDQRSSNNKSKHISIQEFMQKEVEKIDFNVIENNIRLNFFSHINPLQELLKAAT